MKRAVVCLLCLCTLASTKRVYRLQSPKDERPKKLIRIKVVMSVRRAAPRVVLPPNSVMLWWKPGIPVTNSVMTNPPSAGFYDWYGVASRNYTNKVDVGFVTNAIISQLWGLTNSAITYYFAVSAYATNHYSESEWSNEVTWKKLDRIVIVSAGTNQFGLTNSAATSQFFRLRGLSLTNAELQAASSLRGPWSRVSVWSYASGAPPKVQIRTFTQ